MTRTLPILSLCAFALAACSQQPASDTENPDSRDIPAGTATAADPSAPPASTSPREVEGSVPSITPAGFAGYVVGNPIPMAGPDKPVEEMRISDSCRTYRDRGLPDTWIMTDGKGMVQRFVALGTSTLKTAAGIGLGATEAQVRAAYPGIRKEASDYVAAPGGTLYTAPDGQPGLRFDVDEKGRVIELSGGAQPFLGYSEGCA